jgi:hypothetical protein
MAHFAKVENGIVTRVIVAEPEFFDTFVDDSPGQWIQTSYNTIGGIHYDPEANEPDDGTQLRYNYAGVGFHYDGEADAFYPPQQYTSWTLNTETYLWEPPVEHPNDGNSYSWNEENQTWDENINGN